MFVVDDLLENLGLVLMHAVKHIPELEVELVQMEDDEVGYARNIADGVR